MITKTYTFTAIVWLYPGMAAWHFVTVPTEIAQDIEYYFAHMKKGWGSLPVVVTIGSSTWNTSIFPDKKSQSYLLPLKAAIRKKEQVQEGDQISVQLTL